MTQRERQILQLIEADPMISQQQIADTLGITRSSVAVHISNLIKKGCIAGQSSGGPGPMWRWLAVSMWTSAAGPSRRW